MPISKNTAERPTRPRLSRCTIMTWVLLVAVNLIWVSTGCSFHWPQRQTNQERLLGRIDQYYSALKARAYSKTQLFYANRLARSPDKSSSLASKLSLTMASYEIQSLNINDKDAQAIMHVTLAGHENHYDIVMIDNWQFIQGNWYVVDSVQPEADESVNALEQKVWQNSIKW